MVSLVIEDGTIVEGANSLVTAEEFQDYLDDRGITLVGLAATQLFLANDAMWSYSLNGYLVDAAQTTPYPRKYYSINGFEVGATTIPVQAKNAQMELAIAIMQGNSPLASQARIASSVRVGPINIDYSNTSRSSAKVSLPRLDAALSYLVSGSKNGIKFNVSGNEWSEIW